MKQTNAPALAPVADENLWLEEVHGAAAMKWVEERNQESQHVLTQLPGFKKNLQDARKILMAQDRLPHVTFRNGYLYNFWQDDKHVRGLIRSTTVASYKQKNPKWETILDIDALAAKEKEDWVYKGAVWLPPNSTRGLLTLSRGGLDASVIREFDLTTKSFVTDRPFNLPQAKSQIEWIDENTVGVATDFGPGSLTTSGYPRIVKLWKRGQPLSEAKTLLEGQVGDVSSGLQTEFTPEGNRTFVYRSPSFYEDQTFTLQPDGSLTAVAKPASAILAGWFKGYSILQLRQPWKEFKSGSVVALSDNGSTQLIFEPNERQSVSAVSAAKNVLILNYLDSIQGKIARITVKDGVWHVAEFAVPANGTVSVNSANAFDDLVVVGFQSFLVPPSIMALQASGEGQLVTWKQLPARFDSSKYETEQHWATSRDGTKVPYFMIHRKGLKLDGNNAVLIHGYGGFEISLSPAYLALTGKLWLDKGGVFVETNIRGGGEFGPKWHEAALKENRQLAFDDFEAIAEDLIARKVTTSKKLAIQGRSNGGLLVGTAYTQRPDLYGAVICGVPLLDMLRYNKLLAGASWEAEYGSPEDPKMREVILKYSPYQNLKADKTYPEVFFYTSTADDRVHPGHARKMVARMKAQKHPYLYYENTVGGHAGSADLKQEANIQTMIFTFLQNRLL